MSGDCNDDPTTEHGVVVMVFFHEKQGFLRCSVMDLRHALDVADDWGTEPTADLIWNPETGFHLAIRTGDSAARFVGSIDLANPKYVEHEAGAKVPENRLTMDYVASEEAIVSRVQGWFRHLVLGINFGFPLCCIAEFIVRTALGQAAAERWRQRHGDLPLNYVPCVFHTKRLVEQGTA